ncbi:MAG: GTP cyclohydrolase I FolE [Myxococcales bacterium]|nr:GTP cyclohydrolase I FolE [Myxococcales bacterium]USN51565.1 MAG: GTP cyclohydrolase I FolE [Myxococcales bacterium]
MHETIEKSVSSILSTLGENIERPGLRETPERVAKSLAELTSGYRQSIDQIADNAIFDCQSKGMVLQKNIEFYSLCEHHLLPFFGHVHVAYFPNKKIIGLSKVGRIIDMYAKRLQVQEHLNHEIAQALYDLLQPKGVAVAIEANHFCMMMRGVKKQHGVTCTTEFKGIFEEDDHVRKDFLASIKN